MTSFKMSFHGISGRRMVEVWEGSAMIATIYPDDGNRSVRIISKHPMKVAQDDLVPEATIVTFGREIK